MALPISALTINLASNKTTSLFSINYQPRCYLYCYAISRHHRLMKTDQQYCGRNVAIHIQELEVTMTLKSGLEQQGQTILNSHFLTVTLMTGTLYQTLLCQLPV